MNEIEIRRIFIDDDAWERTHKSWKDLKPYRDFNQKSESDESVHQCFERLFPQYQIPYEVIEQWIYPHYYNAETVSNYGWIDYSQCSFKTNSLSNNEIASIKIFSNFRSFVKERSQLIPFDDFMCIESDLNHWKSKQTWRVPPIVIDVESFGYHPKYSELTGPLQLVEGHSRMGYFLSMLRAGLLETEMHKIYLLKRNR